MTDADSEADQAEGKTPPAGADPYRTVPWTPQFDDPQAGARSPESKEAPPSGLRRVEVDAEGMPLPRRVPERDLSRTRVQPRAAFEAHRGAVARAGGRPVRPRPRRPTGRRRWRRAFGCLVTTTAIVAAVVLTALVLVLSWGIYQYYRIAAVLPDVSQLRAHAAQFESTFIYDRRGNLLYEVNDPQAGRRTYVTLDKISPYVIAATIATEDSEFWINPGFDPLAIARALYQNTTEGEVVSGASTITQQLARALLLSPEERAQRTNERKVREIILASQMRADYESDEILELYLNEIYYGNLAYGIEAAAQTYFGRRAADLNFAEAAFLAGLPQSPAIYDVYQDPQATFARQQTVVTLTVQAAGDCTSAAGGIQINSAGDQLCVTSQEGVAAILAIRDPAQYPFEPPRIEARFPHWVNYVRLLLEEEYGAQEIYRSGFRVHTTLDPDLQSFAQQVLTQQVTELASSNVTTGALVVIDPQTGQIWSMIGSDSYDDPKDGQINMAIRPRQPGSSIKPFTYLAAFERGWTPSTLIWDVPSKFPDGANPPYEPTNYDRRFHGPLRVRDTLANSFNVPAVKTLQFVGVYDDPATEAPDGLIRFLERFGITTLTSDQYGLALTLGGGEVTLLEWTGAYATIANQGLRVFPYAIGHIADSTGEVVCRQPTTPKQLVEAPADSQAAPPCQTPPDNWGKPVISREHAFLITDILADNTARLLAFGPGSVLETTVGAAAKTGTTNDIRDTWTMGFTPNLAVGVWIGNADFTPMAEGITSSRAPGPVWHQVIEGAFSILGVEPGVFVPPPGVVQHEICDVTGAAANEYCYVMTNPRYPGRSGIRLEYFAVDQPPIKPPQDVVATIPVDAFSGKLPSEVCGFDHLEERRVVNINDEFALPWLQNDPLGQQFAAVLGIEFPVELAPSESCGPDDPRPVLQIVYPPEDNVPVFEVVQIWGFADVLNGEFEAYRVDWGLGDDPQGWGYVTDPIPERHSDQDSPALLAEFDTRDKPNEQVTIRLVVLDKRGHSAEIRRLLQIDNPTPTPTASAAPTLAPTDVPTATPLPPATATITTLSPTATHTFTATPVPSATTTTAPSSTPTRTPTSTATPVPTETPVNTPAPTATFTVVP